jgi:RNA-directed DNA polymerase
LSSRYVDDIRVIAKSWESANSIIEEVAENIRELGLTLSPEKTLVYKQSTLVDQDREDANFFNDHFASVKASLTQIIFVGGLHEDGTEIEIEPEDKEAAQIAARRILFEWQAAAKASDSDAAPLAPLVRFINRGLATLHDAPERLPDELLSDIVFEYPSKTDHVVRYLISRRWEPLWSEHMESVNALASMGRQSPWSKLWLLSAIEELDPVSVERPQELTEWLTRQLSDQHEVVRAEAAWRHSRFSKNGICNDSPLNKEAAKWVEETAS